MELRSIDWASAVVSPAQPLYELRVRVVPGDIGDEWRRRFNELAKRHSLAMHRAPRWGAVELTDETILVVGVQPDVDVELTQALTSLAEATNAELERERHLHEEEERRRAEEEAERERVADELTQRFRSGPTRDLAAEASPRPFRSDRDSV